MQEILRMAAQRGMKMLGMSVLATGIGTSLVWLGSPVPVKAQEKGVEKPKPPDEAKKPSDAKAEHEAQGITITPEDVPTKKAK